MAIEIITIPDLGGAESVEVIELCVSVGDSVEQEEPADFRDSSDKAGRMERREEGGSERKYTPAK